MNKGGATMCMKNRRFGLRQTGMGLVIVLLASVSAAAQIAPTRTWEELKEETQRRVDKNLGPVAGRDTEDAPQTPARIHSPDRGDTGRAVLSAPRRHRERGKKEE